MENKTRDDGQQRLQDVVYGIDENWTYVLVRGKGDEKDMAALCRILIVCI